MTAGPARSDRRWLLFTTAWFALWGLVAIASVDRRDRAEQAWFEADERRDWPAAERYRLDAASARRSMAIAAGAGFGLPLLLLIVLEARRIISSPRRLRH